MGVGQGALAPAPVGKGPIIWAKTLIFYGKYAQLKQCIWGHMGAKFRPFFNSATPRKNPGSAPVEGRIV